MAWDHSRLNGFTGRSTSSSTAASAPYRHRAHQRDLLAARTGGLLLETAERNFRIDHDQKFKQTTNLQYTFSKTLGAWAALSWRYNSGLVAGSVGPDDATACLTADEQAAIGLYCGRTIATMDAPITSCELRHYGATRLNIPADGAENDVTNPPRIAPRHLFDLGLGIDNLVRTDRTKVKLQFTVVNLTNKIALYNFLSTFSGTHFVTPRPTSFRSAWPSRTARGQGSEEKESS